MRKEQLDAFIISQLDTVVNAMKKIDLNAKGILFVVDEKQHLVGVITDGDIRRWLIKTGNLREQLACIMNKSPKVIRHKEIASAEDYIKKYKITALPVVTMKNQISDIVFRENDDLDEFSYRSGILEGVPVVIMAGGKGTRLYPYTKVLPKPLIPIGDIPIMERIINVFREHGVGDFYATVNYKKEMIKSYFSEITDYEITYVEEDKPLGTAGSLHLIKTQFNCPIFVTNCDILIHADYEDLYRYHRESGNELTVVSALKNIVVPYGVIHASENGKINSMEEKPQLSYFVNTGMYILNPDLLKEIPADTFFHMTDLTDQLIKENRKVGMYPISEDSFLDMGEFEEMRRMEEKLNLKFD